MPTYDYACDDCGHVFEVFERIHDGGVKDCPKCRKKRARRRISAPALIFRGSGFYVTDSKGSSSAASSNHGHKKSEPKPAETKAEAKPSDSKKNKPE